MSVERDKAEDDAGATSSPCGMSEQKHTLSPKDEEAGDAMTNDGASNGRKFETREPASNDKSAELQTESLGADD